MEPIHLIVKITLKSENLIDVYKTLAAKSQREAGCKRYTLTKDKARPNIIYILEEWESIDHLQAHQQTTHYEEMSQYADKVVVEISEVEILQ